MCVHNFEFFEEYNLYEKTLQQSIWIPTLAFTCLVLLACCIITIDIQLLSYSTLMDHCQR